MILQRIKVAVETNTKVKFITSIPVTITIREALPILLKAYLAVVAQNYDQEEGRVLSHTNRIKRIIKNDFLIPLNEEVIHVLNDGDTLFLVVEKSEKKEGENQSKKEKLEAKKDEKNKEKKVDESKPQEKKPLAAPVVEKKEKEVKKDAPKKEEPKNGETKTSFQGIQFDKLLAKVTGKPAGKSSQPQSPAIAAKGKTFIVAPASESSDSS